MVPELDKKQIF